jgi:serine/threonine protein kinase
VPGLVLRRIPADHAGVAAPPSLDSCSRDVYAPGRQWTGAAAQAIADGLQRALDHLHRQGLTHGDLYGHNTVADAQGHALLGDFGAASFLPTNDPVRRAALQRIDRRALGELQAELAARCTDPAAAAALQATAQALLA